MRAWRTLGKVAIVAAFFGVCFVMLARVIGHRSPWLGLLLMFYFLALAKVAAPVFRLRMPSALRALRSGPLADRADRWLGVRGFGRFLRRTPFRHLNDAVYLAGGRRSIAEVRSHAETAEATHFWAAVLFTPYIAYVWSSGRRVEATVFVVVQVAFNVYPILHLRLVRARLDRMARARTGAALPDDRRAVSSGAPTRP